MGLRRDTAPRFRGDRKGRPVSATVDIAIIGEALIDLVDPGDDSPAIAHPAAARSTWRSGWPGSASSAVGRAVLPRPVRHGAAQSCGRSGVDMGSAVTDTRPSTVALVHLHDGIADYEFFVDSTADFAWTDAELAACAGDPAILHFGSLASWLPPGDAAIARFVADRRARGDALISYDPNVRPRLQPDAAAARAAVETALPSTHLVKASTDDLRWLYGDRPEAEIAEAWLALGPSLLVVTHGSDGSRAHVAGAVALNRPAPAVLWSTRSVRVTRS